jgi:hypothetical protein
MQVRCSDCDAVAEYPDDTPVACHDCKEDAWLIFTMPDDEERET